MSDENIAASDKELSDAVNEALSVKQLLKLMR